MTICEGVSSSFDGRGRLPRPHLRGACLDAARSKAGHVTAARSRPRARLEILLLALLYVGYSAARLVTDADLPRATQHADDLLHVEALLNIDIERWANTAMGAAPGVALLGSYWYSLLHYVVTPAVLLWAYRRHPFDYRRVRNALVIGSAIGLVGFALVPMAPPRMLPGYVDTLATTAQHGWWGGDASAPRGLGELTNQLAAMPSLHVGWALWCAWVLATLTHRRWLRVAAWLYPLGTTLVVIGTANHYVLDAVAGVAVMLVGMRLARRRRVIRLPAQATPSREEAVGLAA